MIAEHERIVLVSDVPAQGLQAGDVGTVVHIYHGNQAAEVEFVALDGQTVALATLRMDQIRPVRPGEITHARPLATA